MQKALYSSQCDFGQISTNLNIVMCGNHIGGKGIIEFLLESGVTFKYFVTITKEEAIKNKVSGYYDFSDVAKRYKIPIYYAKSFDLKKDCDFFQKYKFDLLIQGGWQRLFPENILQTLKIGALGIHGGADFLPKFRGRSPLNWSLIENKKRFIMQLFLIKSGVDDGDIIDWFKFDINDFDDIKTLYYKYEISIKYMILRNIKSLENNVFIAKKQTGSPLYYGKRTQKDGEILWESMDVGTIYNLIRATTKPYPCAYSYLKSEKITFITSAIFDHSILYPQSKFGQVVEKFDDGSFLINCIGGILIIKAYECCNKVSKGVVFKTKL